MNENKIKELVAKMEKAFDCSCSISMNVGTYGHDMQTSYFIWSSCGVSVEAHSTHQVELIVDSVIKAFEFGKGEE